jgi:hypothetical protein
MCLSSGFRRERLQTAVSRLKDRLKEVRAQEENQRRWIAYEKVKAERDKLAADYRKSARRTDRQDRDE